jgi:hypothetical protein
LALLLSDLIYSFLIHLLAHRFKNVIFAKEMIAERDGTDGVVTPQEKKGSRGRFSQKGQGTQFYEEGRDKDLRIYEEAIFR